MSVIARGLRPRLGLLKRWALAIQPFHRPTRQKARRYLLWCEMAHELEEIAFHRNGMKWAGFAESLITRELFVSGGYQSGYFGPLIDWLAKHVEQWRRGTTLLNVGANIGDTALPLVKHTGKLCVCCEPMPRTFALLERNVRANDLTTLIRCFPVAIAAQAGRGIMVSAAEPGSSELKTSSGRQGFGAVTTGNEKTEVQTTTVEGLLSLAGLAAPEIALVWSDTQGCETHVVRSGRSLWEAGVPLWAEIWPYGLEVHGGLQEFMASCRECFAYYIPGPELMKRGVAAQPRKIADLDRLIDSLSHPTSFTDALLLP